MIIHKDVQVYHSTNCEMYIEILKGKKSCRTGLHIIFCKFATAYVIFCFAKDNLKL